MPRMIIIRVLHSKMRHRFQNTHSLSTLRKITIKTLFQQRGDGFAPVMIMKKLKAATITKKNV